MMDLAEIRKRNELACGPTTAQVDWLISEVERLKAENEDMREHCIHCIDDPDGDMCNAVAEIETLRARITELTQCDPSWYDMSVADAFRMWKADREELERIRAGNEELKSKASSLSETAQLFRNTAEDYAEKIAALRAEVERLKGELAILKVVEARIEHIKRSYAGGENWLRCLERAEAAESALTRCRNEALEEAASLVWDWGNVDLDKERCCAAIRALKTSPPREGEVESCEWTPHPTLPDMMATSCGGAVDKLAMSMSWGCGYCGKLIRTKE